MSTKEKDKRLCSQLLIVTLQGLASMTNYEGIFIIATGFHDSSLLLAEDSFELLITLPPPPKF